MARRRRGAPRRGRQRRGVAPPHLTRARCLARAQKAQRAKVESRRPDVSACARASWGAGARWHLTRGGARASWGARPRRRATATTAPHGGVSRRLDAAASARGMRCEVQPASPPPLSRARGYNPRAREGVMGCGDVVPVRVPSARAHPPATSWGASCSTRHPTAPRGPPRRGRGRRNPTGSDALCARGRAAPVDGAAE